MYWFVNGEKKEYTGGREKDTIVSWINKKTGPPSSKVSCADLKTKVADSKFVVAFFGKEDDALYKDVHIPYAEETDKIIFAHTEEADCAKEFGGSSPGIVFFRKFETE